MHNVTDQRVLSKPSFFVDFDAVRRVGVFDAEAGLMASREKERIELDPRTAAVFNRKGYQGNIE